MKLKVNADGFAVVQDGKPVYVDDAGKEIAFDAPGTVAAISRLNAEAKTHREKAEGLEDKLKAFTGIDDPAKALKALETVANLNEKKLVEAGERDRAVAEAVRAVEEKHVPVAKRAAALEEKLNGYLISDVFNRSKFISEKFAAKGPAGVQIARALFGDRFKIENDDTVVAFGADGQKLYSKANPGVLAGPDEALEMIVDAYPYKEHLLQGTGASGSGAGGSANSGAGGKKSVPREQFDRMSQSERMAFTREGGIVH